MNLQRVIRVVLVDDSTEFLRAAGSFLRTLPGIDVVGTAVSGTDGVAAVSRLRPDLVLLDFEMPGMTGTEAARAIKAMDGTVRVVLVSLHEQVRRLAASGTGVDGFVAKASFAETCPVVMAQLFADQPDALGTSVEDHPQ